MQVDHVYTWVNPHDPALMELRDRYAAAEVRTDHQYRAGAARIADHDELRLSIRSALKFLPFVRRTIVFGNGAPPPWLHEFGDAVEYIAQGDIVPADMWPNFQSNVAELFIHRIPDLSEHYIYSNDDFFFARTHAPDDFFVGDARTKVGLIPGPVGLGTAATYRAVEENGVRALQTHARPAPFDPGLPPLSEGLRIVRRLKLARQALRFRKRGLRRVNGIAHTSQPYLKSQWPQYMNVFREELAQICTRRFRSEDGIGVNFIYHHYLYGEGKAELHIARADRHLRRSASDAEREGLRRDLLDPCSDIARYCLNDTPVDSEDDGWFDYIRSIADIAQRRP